MDATTLTPAAGGPTALGTTSSVAGLSTGETPSPTSDFDTFLQLLTAQIRNQDPLEPADSTAYTAQLATFSNVEQSVKTNELLSEMIASLNGQQVGSVSEWIGMEVRHSGPVVHDGGTNVLHPDVPATADRAELVVIDETGKEVARHTIDPRAETVAWPAAGSGASVADGSYSLRVDSWSGERALDPTSVSHYGRVTEVVLAPGGTELVLDGAVRIPADGFESIRGGES